MLVSKAVRAVLIYKDRAETLQTGSRRNRWHFLSAGIPPANAAPVPVGYAWPSCCCVVVGAIVNNLWERVNIGYMMSDDTG